MGANVTGANSEGAKLTGTYSVTTLSLTSKPARPLCEPVEKITCEKTQGSEFTPVGFEPATLENSAMRQNARLF